MQLHVLSTFRSYASKNNNASSNKENLLAISYVMNSDNSYITTVLMLASGHPGLETKILYSIQCCMFKYTNAQPLVENAHV